MNNLLRLIHEWLTGEASSASAPKVKIHRTYMRASWKSGSRDSVIVQRDPRPYWQERGWSQKKGVYQGHFQTVFGTWHGCGTVSPSGRVEIFIHDPPSRLERHPHWPCFRARGDGWYFVHPVSPVNDISAGILGVEKTICEAYKI
jgi:hypothetical protein